MARPSVVLTSTLKEIAGLDGLQLSAPRGGVSGRISALLRRAIVNVDLIPGTALNETDVADLFGVSRTPVREAFRSLATEGLIEVVPQKGTFVSHLNRSTLRDALFVREALECAAARLAARAPEPERRVLLRIVERQAEALRHDDQESSFLADEDFHRTILSLSGHISAWEPVRQARTHLDRLRRLASAELKGSEEALQHHRGIAEAVARGDERAAVELLRTHILQIEGFIDRIAEIHADYIE